MQPSLRAKEIFHDRDNGIVYLLSKNYFDTDQYACYRYIDDGEIFDKVITQENFKEYLPNEVKSAIKKEIL